MFSLLRIPLAPRTFLAVTHTHHHIRRFASEISPDVSSLLPAPSQSHDDENHDENHKKNHEDDRPLRQPHGIKIDKEGHGLSLFYRKFRQTDPAVQTNPEVEVWEWALVEAKDPEKGNSGRSLISSGLVLVVTSIILFNTCRDNFH